MWKIVSKPLTEVILPLVISSLKFVSPYHQIRWNHKSELVILLKVADRIPSPFRWYVTLWLTAYCSRSLTAWISTTDLPVQSGPHHPLFRFLLVPVLWYCSTFFTWHQVKGWAYIWVLLRKSLKHFRYTFGAMVLCNSKECPLLWRELWCGHANVFILLVN